MFTAAQILYLSEVLGVSPTAYRSTSAGPTVSPAVANGLVLTPRLIPQETALLGKILAAVGGQNWTHLEIENPQIGVLPPTMEAPAIALLFCEDSLGRKKINGTEWVALPAISQMLGDGPQVAANKKMVWEELKRFKA